MLNHTKKVREMYEDIQRRLFYMIPEKWDKLFLYSSVLDEPDKEGKTGELFFYYIPKGIFRKKPINVYEIPAKLNLDEKQYKKLVQILYQKIKELRKEFKKSEKDGVVWSNITMSIQDLKFKVVYDYTNLAESDFSSYERHVIWRYENLGITDEQLSKEDKEILKRYRLGARTLSRKEYYDAGIYIKDIQNMIAYSTEPDAEEPKENTQENSQTKPKNQLLMTQEEITKMKSK